jgi:acyl-CoA synthetase (AMP-forming)/AMP-acid ligase II
VLRRWPGRLVEFYGMTEGGASCILEAGDFPDKLHTVGQPPPGHEIRFIDDAGREVPRGEVGEIVGHSTLMMNGYHGLPDKTREAEWRDAEGRRYIRHGDLGRFDKDGFLILMGRAKDLIISGGFNIYPADLEDELLRNPAVADASVVAAPSEQWGETPVGFVVLRDAVPLAEILADANSRLGRTQRISALHALDELPRNAIGTVLKRQPRELLTSWIDWFESPPPPQRRGPGGGVSPWPSRHSLRERCVPHLHHPLPPPLKRRGKLCQSMGIML